MLGTPPLKRRGPVGAAHQSSSPQVPNRSRMGIAPEEIIPLAGQPSFTSWDHGESMDIDLLVGGLEHFLFSHILGIIIPIDWYFSEGFKPPTSLWCLWMSYDIDGIIGLSGCISLIHRYWIWSGPYPAMSTISQSQNQFKSQLPISESLHKSFEIIISPYCHGESPPPMDPHPPIARPWTRRRRRSRHSWSPLRPQKEGAGRGMTPHSWMV